MRAYVDTAVLLWHLRGDTRALRFLRHMGNTAEYELWIGAMQRAEVVFFMYPEEEEKTLLLLSQFRTAAVDQAIVDKAGRLSHPWNPSHGVDPDDAILAATVMESGGIIYCLNARHYPMPEVIVQKEWCPRRARGRPEARGTKLERAGEAGSRT